ncbi:GPO family capsid scaffolding protein [Pseudomonas sp. UBA6310]|uniref:GPO family capsid scaffolding protein n=1 Tax=Pseudomonas sp. UBA6310 TaxID=1947327 RepID=UPI00257F7D17|nr:GPO family capsid scaffolding protein [Pseudomonas sp. UBA6310]
MPAATKKFRSKWVRIFCEGATTDGRTVERAWIEQMAASYDPNTYGARLNCEHIRGLGPDSVFGAFGDVLALKAEEVDIAGEKKLALFAQIEPTDSLIELNKKGQKIYTSAEVQPNFAESGKAYLVGLAITDSPASLGTEALKFSAHRKLHKENLFSVAEEVALEFEEVVETPSMFAALRDKVSNLLSKSTEKEGKDAASFTALGELIEQLATHGAEQAKAFASLNAEHDKLRVAHTKLSADFAELVARLGDTEDHSQQQRPPVSGGNGQVVAEF